MRRWIDEGYLVEQGQTRKAMVTYREIADKAAELIYTACQRGAGKDKGVKAVVDPFNPRGSSTHVSFITTKTTLYETGPSRSHVNFVVCDSDWEAELARVVEAHPKVIAYVKNQGLGLEVPYRDGPNQKRYIPDFIVQVDDGNGRDDPLNVIVEIKGYRDIDVQLKSETIRTLWVPGVNNLATSGRWTFAEFNNPFEIEAEFAKLVESADRGQRRSRWGGTLMAKRGTEPKAKASKPTKSRTMPARAATAKKTAPRIKKVEAISHATTSSRRNIPTAEYQDAAENQEAMAPKGPVRLKRQRPLAHEERRSRDSDKDPQIVWKGVKLTLTPAQLDALMERAKRGEPATIEIGDAQLVWRGKDEQDWSDLVVNAPPLYIQEKIHPKAIIDDLVRQTTERAEAQS